MKIEINKLEILSKICAVLSVACILSALFADYISAPQIIDKMYQSPKGMKVIISALFVEMSKARVINISELGSVFFISVSAVLRLYCKVKLLEEKIESRG